MPLTDTFIKTVKPTGKPAGDKHTDGFGLYLLVKPAGKYWRMDYRHAGKRKTLALGVYPVVTLAQARKRRDDARAKLANGVDPGVTKRAEKIASKVAAAGTFESIAREYHATKQDGWVPKYAEGWLRRLENDLFPYIGSLPLAEITAPMLLDALRRTEKRGVRETTHKLRQLAGQVFRYGVQTGRCQHNPATDLHGALKPKVVRHMPALLEQNEVGGLLRAIDGYTGLPTTKAAMRLSALIFQRPGNVRSMEWAWVDLDKAMLTIPAEAMKRKKMAKLNGRPHFVPLAPQAVEILREVHLVTGHGRYCFSSLRTASRPMSENTINAAFRRMGYTGDEIVAHGFRAMARTMMVEQMPDVHPDVIEAQLAHVKSGPLGAAYDRAEFMAQRRVMMKKWADYLDHLHETAGLTPVLKAA